MWELVDQKAIELAFSLAGGVLKERLDDWNRAALDRKKAAREAKERKKRAIILDNDSAPADLQRPDGSEKEEIVLAEDEMSKAEIELSPDHLFHLLNDHLKIVEQWCSSASFADVRGDKEKVTLNIYVDLDAYVTPSRLHIDPVEKESTVPLLTAVAQRGRHCIILGQPGAGKTTAMKKLCLTTIYGTDETISYSFPLLIRCKDLRAHGRADRILTDAIAEILNFRLRISGGSYVPTDLKKTQADAVDTLQRAAFLKFLDGLGALIVLNGFDEFPDSSQKVQLASEIQMLAVHLTKSKNGHNLQNWRI